MIAWRWPPGQRAQTWAPWKTGSKSSLAHGGDPQYPHLLAPCDLQVVKAAGVTFAASMLERMIEEQARGEPQKAHAIRASMTAIVGEDLSAIEPRSSEAKMLKEVLSAQGLWSQYLEVGIGADAEVFTKAARCRRWATVRQSACILHGIGTSRSRRSCWL